jgi:DNA-binding NarL/FixJ family response regulator
MLGCAYPADQPRGITIATVDPPSHLRATGDPPVRAGGRGWLRTVSPAGPELTEREVVLVRWLALGYTDTSAARRMGISARSVSNIMRALMNRFGVQNRFQLGLALGRLGLAPPSGDTGP